MKKYIRRVWPGTVLALFLLAGTLAPAILLTEKEALASPVPDLTIKNIVWSPQNPSTGDMVTFTVTIENQGDGPTGFSHIAFNIDDSYKDSETINTIAAGAIAIRTFTWKALAGSHTFKSIADSKDAISESDETNNTATFAFSVAAPDLIIENISWSPENPSVQDQVTFTVTIKNQGNIPAAYSFVDFLIDGSSRNYRDIRVIDAGDNVTKTFTWTAKAGSHTIEAIADVLNQVKESDETNNDKMVGYSTATPDLIVQDITWPPESYTDNSTLTFSVIIKNQGDGKAEPSYVAYYIDNTYQTSEYVSIISINGTITKTFEWPIQPGSHTVKAVTDSNNTVIESDDANNEKTVALAGSDPDLIIDSISWSQSNPVALNTVTFPVSITNQGSTKAGYSRIYFYINDSFKGYKQVQEIDTDETLILDFIWPLPWGSHTIKVVADGENYIDETDESNNVKTIAVTISPPNPSDLIVQDIVCLPENPLTGETVNITISIKNQGVGNASPFPITYYIDDVYQDIAYIDPIDAGSTITKVLTWTAQEGSHILKVIIDPNDLISESDEANNSDIASITVLAHPAPDLVIKDIRWSPVNPSAGDLVTTTATIENQGNDSISSHSRLAYYVDGSYRGSHDVQEMDAGAAVTRDFTWTFKESPHVIKVVADVEDQILESDENNNDRILALPPPDLVINSITWSPTNPAPGDMVTFTVSVSNQGSSEAGLSCISYYIDDLFIKNNNIKWIATGATTIKTFAWTAQAELHSIKFIADGENQVTEFDESNNEKSVSLSVSLPTSANTTPGSQPTLISTTFTNQPDAIVQVYGESSNVFPGQDVIFYIDAVNPASNPTMTVDLVMMIPSGITVSTPELTKGEAGRYRASYVIEPGESRLIELHMMAQDEGDFNIMSDLSYYFADEKVTAEHQISSLPLIVGTEAVSDDSQGSTEKSPFQRLPRILADWWVVIAAVTVGGVAITILLKLRKLQQ
ncbi:CARDB domain-containing protein [Chloroflexota bacterium]